MAAAHQPFEGGAGEEIAQHRFAVRPHHQQVGRQLLCTRHQQRGRVATVDHHSRPAAGLLGQTLGLRLQQGLGLTHLILYEYRRRIVIDRMHQAPVPTALTSHQLHGALRGMCRALGKVGRHQYLVHLILLGRHLARSVERLDSPPMLDADQARRGETD